MCFASGQHMETKCNPEVVNSLLGFHSCMVPICKTHLKGIFRSGGSERHLNWLATGSTIPLPPLLPTTNAMNLQKKLWRDVRWHANEPSFTNHEMAWFRLLVCEPRFISMPSHDPPQIGWCPSLVPTLSCCYLQCCHYCLCHNWYDRNGPMQNVMWKCTLPYI